MGEKMPTVKQVYLTNAGLEKVQQELLFLKNERRPEIINALKEARALGDLSENAEYDSARTEQALVETRIQELESMVEKAVIVKEVKTDKVAIGTNVKLKYVLDESEEVYSIVGSVEADPFNNKISNESPIARAIMGLKIGKKVTVDSPNGKYDVEIVEIF